MRFSAALFVFALFSLTTFKGSSQVIINEGSNKNYSTVADENGDYPDWIEIFNPGTNPVSLYNYSLTDDPANPTKWTFPNITLDQGAFKVVFCSGKNRKPISGFVNVLSEQNYNPTTGWNTHVFTTPFMWDGVSSLLLNVCSYNVGYTTNSVFNQTATPYYSTVLAFQDGNPSLCQAAYGAKVQVRPNLKLNNNVIGTGTVQNSPYDYPAPYGNWYWGAKNQMIIPAAELLASGLSAGYITSLSFDVTSTDPNTFYQYIDFSIKPVSYSEVSTAFEVVDTALCLHTNFKINNNGETIYLYNATQTLLSALPVNCPQPDISTGLFPDANQTSAPSLFLHPTPQATNNGSQTYSSSLLPPVIGTSSGFFNNPVYVTLYNPNGPLTEIRYTTDGNEPDTSSALYTGAAIPFFYSGVLKARSYSTTQLPSEVVAATYFLGVNHTTPILSVITDPQNLYGPTGIFDNWPLNWERAAYAEYFDTANQRIFSQAAGMQIDGGWGGSRSHPQHSFRLELDHSVLGDGPVNHVLIPNRPDRQKYSKIYLRNGSNYYLAFPHKDALHLEAMGAETNNYYSAWRPVSVYVNGAYFGLYELREKMDAEYFEVLEEADSDSMDLLSLTAWNNYLLLPLEGSVDSFSVDYNAFTLLNPSDSLFWAQADNYFDLAYYADYIIGETWVGNIDWPGNNIKIYRSNATGFRWRFCLMDLEGSMLPGGFSTASDDHIAYVLGADPANPYINIFLRSIQNQRFKRYFINRYADLMNTSYGYSRMEGVANDMFNQTVIEMPNEYQRWGDPNNINGQMAAFVANHQTLLQEYQIRNQIVRDDIQFNFGLNDQEDVVLDVFPQGSGKILLNTITPETLPWTGVYFDGNPVSLTAIPTTGATFSHWEITGPGGIGMDTSISIERNIPTTTLFKAVFLPGSAGQLELNRQEFSVFPNPSQGLFHVFNQIGEITADEVEAEIFNISGNIIQKTTSGRGVSSFSIDISEYPKGIYFLKLKSGSRAAGNFKLILR